MQVQFSEKSSHIPSLDLLTNYGTFYKNQTISKIVKAVKGLNLTYEVSSENSKITFKNINDENDKAVRRAIFAKNYFLALPNIEQSHSKSELCFSIDLQPNDENHFYANLIKIANSHEDPVKFIIDHKFYWTFRSPQAIALLSKLENLEKPGVMTALEGVLEGKNANFETNHQAIVGLGRALTIPHLKEKAKSLLLQIAVFDNYQYTTYFKLREIAWQQLKPVIDEPDVRAVFEQITKDDPRIPLRLEALNYLDKIDHYEDELNVKIIKNIISTFNIDNLNDCEGSVLDYILWNNQPHSCQALRACGEEMVARSLLKQFLTEGSQLPAIKIKVCRSPTTLGEGSVSVSKTAHFYSLLKFIGVNTTNQTLFSDIVHALIKVTGGRDLGLLESLQYVLAHLRGNPAVQMPHIENIEIKHIVLNKKPNTAFGNLSRSKDWEQYKPKRVLALISILQSEEDVSLRKVAIRSCGEYLFTEYKYRWEQEEYETYAKQICPCLEQLALSESTDKEVVNEALRVLNLYKSK